MRKGFILSVLLIVLISTFGFGQEAKFASINRQQDDSPEFVGFRENAIVVKFDRTTLSAIVKSELPSGRTGIFSLDQLGGRLNVSRITQRFPNAEDRIYQGRDINLKGWHKFRFSGDVDIEDVVERYKAIPGVQDAQPIGIHRIYENPNDTRYSDQWHLNQANDHDIDAPEAWNIETGNDGILVAILDTGVRYFHKDLGGANASFSNSTDIDGNIWINWAEKNGTNGVDDDGNGFVDDWVGWDFVESENVYAGEDGSTPDNDPRDFNGHGTHCAGIVAALNNNGYATSSPAGGWGNGSLQSDGDGVKIMPLRIGWSWGRNWYEVGYIGMDYAANAFVYAADNGANIASCSWGSSNSGGLGDAVDYFLSKGGMVFHASGNGSADDPDYLDNRGDCISVASTDQDDKLSDFSNYGTWVDVSAPGTDILSTYHDHTDPENDYVASLSGTSMATPLSASVAALIWSKNPSWSANQVEQQLYDSADEIDGLNPSYAGKLGAGRVNAFNAINTGGPIPPTAEFSGSPTSGCKDLTVNFSDQSSGEVTSWNWDFGDGGSSTAQNPSHVYTSTGTFTVSLTVDGPGGSDSETKTNYIAVSEAPAADFTGIPTTGDAPLTVNFTDQSSGDVTSWSWDFGDGGTSTAQNPIHVYSTAGSYTVMLTATNSCGSDVETKADYVTVTDPPCDPPAADFTGIPATGDAPLTVNFTDQTTNTPTSWSWDFGDGGTSTAQNPNYVYSTAGTYTVMLTATNSCGSDVETKADYIIVTEPPCDLPVTDFTGTPTTGDAPLTVNFTDQTTNGPTSWSWDFGDGGTSTAQNPSHVYITAGTYTVMLAATNSCGSDVETKADYITVSDPPCDLPVADFTGTPTTGDAPLTVNFTDQTTNGPTSWNWDFGDGGTSTVQNPVHQYTVSGSFTVKLTATNDCGSGTETKTDYIIVNEPANNVMHVQSVNVVNEGFFRWRRGKATVRIVDVNNLPVSDATVSGQWSGDASNSNEFQTGSDGYGTTYSDWVRNGSSFTFCVNNVTKSGWTYDEDANDETCGGTDGSSSITNLGMKDVNMVELQHQTGENIHFNYPNPFNPGTTISFLLPTTSHVSVEIYNVLGKKIATLLNEKSDAGFRTVYWDARDSNGNDVGAGFYFYRIIVNNQPLYFQKILYLK